MKIAPEVTAVLERCTAEGNLLRINGQLDRKAYEQVNKILEAAGGKWNRSAKGHVFDGDAKKVLKGLIGGGEVATQQEMGAFFTPADLVKRMLAAADLEQWMLVLEPSAGAGNIAREAAKLAGVDCVEIQPRYAEALLKEKRYQHVIQGDFLELKPEAKYDRVVMNPPFAHQADIDHVLHALKFLKPGGRLVAIMCANILFRENKKTKDFNTLVEFFMGSVEKLPPESFKDAGTEVPTVLVQITARER